MKSQVMKNRIHLAAHPNPSHGQPRETEPRAPCSYREVEESGQKGMVPAVMPRLLHPMPLDHKAMSWLPHF